MTLIDEVEQIFLEALDLSGGELPASEFEPQAQAAIRAVLLALLRHAGDYGLGAKQLISLVEDFAADHHIDLTEKAP